MRAKGHWHHSCPKTVGGFCGWLVFQEVASGIGGTALECFSSCCPLVFAEVARAEQSLRALGGSSGRALD